jgi:FkbH-like protein
VRAAKTLDTASLKHQIRIAILSDAASQQFVPLLRTLFHENGIGATIYEGAFDALEIEAFDSNSGLYTFRPDIVVLANCSQALRGRYYQHSGPGFADAAAESAFRIWDAIKSHCPARIIQCNYVPPLERQFGHYDLKVAHSLYSSVIALNQAIAAGAKTRGNVLICDVDSIASNVGRNHWYDERLWCLTKAFCNLEYLPLVAQAIAQIAGSTLGRVVKCVILDLDNTLWGGVVGDDGPLGIEIGPHGDGEAFYHFQNYLLTLKNRGILLAVCSKNNLENALQPFLENPGMVLKRDDITVFVANWDDKAGNIRAIRETLEIGLDSMVFLDDNPFERNLVRELVPEVIVPELPEDPADYVQAVSQLNLFESSSFSAEDVARAGLYKQEAERRELQTSFSNIDDYLKSLDMKIEAARFEKSKISRIAQLIQRSNQFNLTTHRYSEAECEQMMLNHQECVPLYASLRDRFGDHGLISIVILRLLPESVEISDWLMSCRVLARGVEHALMTRVVGIANSRNARQITGDYIPTAKNAMVKDFYAQFGFSKVEGTEGRSQWHLDPAAYQPRAIHITEDV